MQARGFVNHRLKYCWPKIIYCSLYVNQTNLKGILIKNWGGAIRDQAKIWGSHGPPRPPLRIATVFDTNCKFVLVSRRSAGPLWRGGRLEEMIELA